MDKKTRQTMKDSIKEGSAYSVMNGFGNMYINPYAIFQKATSVQLALLNSLPQLASALSQLLTSPITKKIGSRKKTLSLSVLLQAISWLPIIFVFMFPNNNILYLILFFTLCSIFGFFAEPSWRSIMGDVVPNKIKGVYFGKRNRVISLVTFISILTAGLILQFFSKGNPLIGFIIIFSAAMISRFISWRYIDNLNDPNEGKIEDDKTTLRDFLKSLSKTNAGLFVIYSSLLIFSVRIASPFFDPYMLNDMSLEYVQYIVIRGASVLSTFIFMPIWGKYSDIFGNKRVLSITGLLIGFVPLLWTLSTNITYLITVQFFSGFVWAGFNLSSFNFFFDANPRSKNLKFFSYFNVLNGLSVFIGALLGGYLVRFGGMFWSNFYFVFIISGMMRILMWLIFLPKVKENKYVKETTEFKLLWSITDDVFTTMAQPVVQLIDRRSTIKYKSKVIIRWVRKQLKKLFGNKYGYS